MKTPYTTRTGIKIGCMYEPPRQQMTVEEERMQAALLGIKEDPVWLWGAVSAALVTSLILMASCRGSA
jgi:hypothetical protein